MVSIAGIALFTRTVLFFPIINRKVLLPQEGKTESANTYALSVQPTVFNCVGGVTSTLPFWQAKKVIIAMQDMMANRRVFFMLVLFISGIDRCAVLKGWVTPLFFSETPVQSE